MVRQLASFLVELNKAVKLKYSTIIYRQMNGEPLHSAW